MKRRPVVTRTRTAAGAGAGSATAVSSGSAHRAFRARERRRRRRLAGLFRLAVFLLLIFVAVWAGVRVAHAGEDARIYTGDRVVVEPGQSLWSIADDEYGAGVDLRRAVYEVRRANRLVGSSVRPGQELVLPSLAE